MCEAVTSLTGYPSIDKPWLKYYSDETIHAPLPECTVYRNIWQHNRAHASETVLEYYGHKISYGKLFEQVELCAKALKSAGTARGDRITLCTAGVPEAVYLVLACSKIGAVANFLNPLFSTEQMIDRINDTGAKLLFVLDKMYSYIAAAIDKTCIKHIIIIPATGSLPAPIRALAALKAKPDVRLKAAMQETKYIFWRNLIQAGKSYAEQTEELYQKDTPVVMVYSSGTTGASKGIVLTNDGLNATIAQYDGTSIGIERGRSFLSIVPVWFSTGIVVCLIMPMCLGVKCVLEPVFGPEPFTKAMLRYKPNSTLAATSIWLDLINEARKRNVDLSNILVPTTGGEQLLPRTERMINDLMANCNAPSKMQKGWGMCELGATVATSSDKHNKIGSVGLPLPKVVVAAFNPDTNEEMPYCGRGELRVITPCRMREYYKNPAATAEFFRLDKNGKTWGCTGDMGYVDEDGDVFILGRMSDSYVDESGQKVYLFDIENVILQDEAIALCEVVDVATDGRIVPVAHITLSDGRPDDGVAVIKRIAVLCSDRLPTHAVPYAYKIRADFPVKPSGKRDTAALQTEHGGFVNASGEPVKL